MTIPPDRLARLEELLDRQDILDCLTRCRSGMDRFDREVFLSAFHPDAVIAAGPFVGGPVELYDWASNLHAQGQSATMHNLLNVTCEIDGDTAHVETYYLFVGRNRDALQTRACLCNEAVKHHFEEVLRGVYPTEEEGRTA